MANSWFQFKQFKVNQDKAAMKVGTDGVLLGAWTDVENTNTILDVGTGTGLIALMAAQRNPQAHITAIDIDENACIQAHENFTTSPWQNRLITKHNSLDQFGKENNFSFDLIICNPPFFKNAYKSNNSQRNKARHNDSLPFEKLIEQANQLTNTTGRLAVIIPYEFETYFIEEAKKYKFNLLRLLHVKPTPEKGIVRSMLEFSKNKITSVSQKCIIVESNGRHGYSEEYKALTKEFYLSF